MPKLPGILGDKAIQIFSHLGFCFVRQKGGHVILRKGEFGCVIPLHKELAVGTLKSAVKQAGGYNVINLQKVSNQESSVISGEYTFYHKWASFSGDERALSKDTTHFS